MNTEYFTLNSEIVNLILDLKSQFPENSLKISDVVDEEGHQYIDLVQEGGGVLGIALLGSSIFLKNRFRILGKMTLVSVANSAAMIANSAAIFRPSNE